MQPGKGKKRKSSKDDNFVPSKKFKNKEESEEEDEDDLNDDDKDYDEKEDEKNEGSKSKRKTKQVTKQVAKPKSVPTGPFPSYDDWLNDLGEWASVLKEFLDTGRLKKIHDVVEAKYKTDTICPSANNILSAFKRVPFSKLRVVIVGQDPYIKPEEATGLSFSVPKSVKMPANLRNIFKALENDDKINFKKPQHGDLSNWAKQGVLLFNAVLTVKAGEYYSHKGLGWEDFTDAVIEAIGSKLTGVVFFLWGKSAQAMKKFIDCSKHLVLEYAHPTSGVDFSKCRNFSEANKYLESKGGDPIDWNVD